MIRSGLTYGLLVLLPALFRVGAEPAHAQIAVIAHQDVPSDSLDRNTLLDYYTGDLRSWSNNEPVVVLDLSEDREIRSAFYQFLGKTSSRMRSIWMRRKLSGEGDPPEAVPSEHDMIARVAGTPGAIGFVEAEYVDDSVKILLTVAMNLE